MVDYEDDGVFRAVFQRLIGMPPGAYRRRFRTASHYRRENARRFTVALQLFADA